MSNIPIWYLKNCCTGKDEAEITYGLRGAKFNRIPAGNTEPSPPLRPRTDDEKQDSEGTSVVM